MKIRILLLLAGLSCTLGISAASARAQDAIICTNQTLIGDYGYTLNGQIQPPGAPAPVPQQGIAMVHFNGDGTFTQVDFVMTNGAPSVTPLTPLNSSGFRTDERGTYTVNSDCTGTKTINSYTKDGTLGATIEVKFVLAQGGREVREIATQITIYTPGGPIHPLASILADGRKLGPSFRED
jgi:hypothetical protein